MEPIQKLDKTFLLIQNNLRITMSSIDVDKSFGSGSGRLSAPDIRPSVDTQFQFGKTLIKKILEAKGIPPDLLALSNEVNRILDAVQSQLPTLRPDAQKTIQSGPHQLTIELTTPTLVKIVRDTTYGNQRVPQTGIIVISQEGIRVTDLVLTRSPSQSVPSTLEGVTDTLQIKKGNMVISPAQSQGQVTATIIEETQQRTDDGRLITNTTTFPYDIRGIADSAERIQVVSQNPQQSKSVSSLR